MKEVPAGLPSPGVNNPKIFIFKQEPGTAAGTIFQIAL
jgi:hypothetical protein